MLKDNKDLGKKRDQLENTIANLNEALKTAKYEISRLQTESTRDKEIFKKEKEELQTTVKEQEHKINQMDARIGNLIYQLNYKKENNDTTNNPKREKEKKIKVKQTSSKSLSKSPSKEKKIKSKFTS